jgi:hypothetical protein
VLAGVGKQAALHLAVAAPLEAQGQPRQPRLYLLVSTKMQFKFFAFTSTCSIFIIFKSLDQFLI